MKVGLVQLIDSARENVSSAALANPATGADDRRLRGVSPLGKGRVRAGRPDLDPQHPRGSIGHRRGEEHRVCRLGTGLHETLEESVGALRPRPPCPDNDPQIRQMAEICIDH